MGMGEGGGGDLFSRSGDLHEDKVNTAMNWLLVVTLLSS